MLQQNIVQGPDRAPESTIDRTQILDPKDYWPDAMACPDWPALRPGQGFDGLRGKLGAEQRLQALASYLNRGPGKITAPTVAERDRERARMFRPGEHQWGHLGIRNLSAAGVLSSGEADLIVEACHIRGYLRKLEAAEVCATEEKERRRLADARQVLAGYRSTAPAEIDEIKSLSEASARHQQRLDDERAFDRSRMLRDHVATLHGHAVTAAHTLGLSVPDAPEFL